MRPFNLCSIALTLSLAAAPAAFADTITYATIDGSNQGQSNNATVTGSIGGVTFTYTGGVAFVDSASGGSTDYFNQPAGVYTSTTASNAPTGSSMIAIQDPNSQQSGVTHTFTFSTPVTNLIFDEFSLGQGGVPTTYTFTSPFTVISCGASTQYGGGCFSTTVGGTSTVLSGQEANGAIEFAGPISSLSFTTANGEYWNGFEIGLGTQVTATPEPSSLVLLGTGILGLAGAAKRKLRS